MGAPLTDFFAPRRCHICGEVIGSFFLPQPSAVSAAYCAECRQTLAAAARFRKKDLSIANRMFGSGIPFAFFLFDYAGESVRRAILHLKQNPDPAAVAFFARYAALLIRQADPAGRFPFVVPIPCTEQRSVDVVEHIARTSVLYLPERTPLVLLAREHSAAASQKGLDMRTRFENAFRLMYSDCPEDGVPPRILLFDDIVTTGATASAAARLLRRIGVKEIRMVSLAGTVASAQQDMLHGGYRKT